MDMDLHLARRVATLPHNYPRDAWAVACDILAASGLVNDAERGKRLERLLDQVREADARRALRAVMLDTGIDVDYHDIPGTRRRLAVIGVAVAAMIAVAIAHAALSAAVGFDAASSIADKMVGW